MKLSDINEASDLKGKRSLLLNNAKDIRIEGNFGGFEYLPKWLNDDLKRIALDKIEERLRELGVYIESP